MARIGDEAALQPQGTGQRGHRAAGGEPGDEGEQRHPGETERDDPGEDAVDVDDDAVAVRRTAAAAALAVVVQFGSGRQQQNGHEKRDSRRHHDGRCGTDEQTDVDRGATNAPAVGLVAHDGLPAR